MLSPLRWQKEVFFLVHIMTKQLSRTYDKIVVHSTLAFGLKVFKNIDAFRLHPYLYFKIIVGGFLGLDRPPLDCATVLCAAPSCNNPTTPEGQCCPVCPDCSAVLCLRPECSDGSQPIAPPGECCAVCPTRKCTIIQCNYNAHHCLQWQ